MQIVHLQNSTLKHLHQLLAASRYTISVEIEPALYGRVVDFQCRVLMHLHQCTCPN